MNTYPVDAIREYREQLNDLSITAQACDGCESGGWFDINDTDTMCVEHAAVRTVYRRELAQKNQR